MSYVCGYIPAAAIGCIPGAIIGYMPAGATGIIYCYPATSGAYIIIGYPLEPIAIICIGIYGC